MFLSKTYIADQKHGRGQFTWPDGRKFIGNWVEGKQQGYGVYYLPNHPPQYGVWVDGKRTSWLSIQEVENLKKQG